MPRSSARRPPWPTKPKPWRSGFSHGQTKDYDALAAEFVALKAKIAAARNPRIGRMISFYPHEQGLKNLKSRQLDAEKAAAAQRLLAGAVTARFPDRFKLQDALDQNKIVAAFREAAPEDVVAVIANQDGPYYRPGSTIHDVTAAADDKDPPKHGGYVLWDENGQGIFISFALATHPDPIAKNTPGLIWGTNPNGSIVFVSLDGGRYVGQPSDFTQGLPQRPLWPTAIQHDTLVFDDIAEIADAGGLPAKTAAAVVATKQKADACADAQAAKFTPQFEALDAANILNQTRQNRAEQLRQRQRTTIYSACKPHRANVEKAWLAAVEANLALRRKTRDAFVARFAALPAPATP